MKNRLSLIILLLCSSAYYSYCQSYFDSLTTTTKVITCTDVSAGSSFHFARFIESQKYDSAKQLLDYWQSKCGAIEPVFRANLVLRMLMNEPIQNLLDQELIEYLIYYDNYSSFRYTYLHNGYLNYTYSNQHVAQEFDSLTHKFFKKELPSHEIGSNERLLCEFYGNGPDSFYTTMQRLECDSSFICKEYKKEVGKYLNMIEGNYAFMSGVWLPTGGIKQLGVHPLIGVQGGVKYKRLNVDATLYCTFLKSKTQYFATRVNSNDSTEATDHFFGIFLGIDLGYDILRAQRNELQLLGGVGYDGYDALDVVDENKSTELKAEVVSSYNFNFGLGYRYYINNWTYLGLRAKYNVVDYTTNGVVNFTGNPVTITFVVGGLSNQQKKYGLERLGYYNIRK